jgi:hypothetical protein
MDEPLNTHAIYITRSSENANDNGRRFDKMMVLAPPVGIEPTMHGDVSRIFPFFSTFARVNEVSPSET